MPPLLAAMNRDRREKGFQWLIICLILSLSLNSAFLTITIARWLQSSTKTSLTLTHTQKLSQSYFWLQEKPFEELCEQLQNFTYLAHGLTMADLAAAILYKDYDIDIARALNTPISNLSPRSIQFHDTDPSEQQPPKSTIIFAGLNRKEIFKITHFIQSEEFPWSCQGMHRRLRQQAFQESTQMHRALEIMQTFPELLRFSEQLCAHYPLQKQIVLSLWLQTPWEILQKYFSENKNTEKSPEEISDFLLASLPYCPQITSRILIEDPRTNFLEKIDNQELVLMIEQINSQFQRDKALDFLQEVLNSPRNDLIHWLARKKILTITPQDHNLPLTKDDI